MRRLLKNNYQTPVLIVGLICVILLYLPIIILNKDALYIVHDQLDGEVLTYILGAQNLNQNIFPNLFDGALKTALTPASPASLIFYRLFSPVVAFITNYVFVALVSYLGMFMCLNRCGLKGYWGIILAVMYSILPFYSVYGLSVMGQPLLLYAFLLLYEKRKIVAAYCFIVLFGVFSSLVLVGYADILILIGLTCLLWIKKHTGKLQFTIGVFLLILIYLITNYQLIGQILFNNVSEISHKTEMIAQSTPFLQNFMEMFVNGHYHAVSRHTVILAAVIIIMLFILYKRIFHLPKRFYQSLVSILGACLMIALIYAFWKSPSVVEIRIDWEEYLYTFRWIDFIGCIHVYGFFWPD